MRRNVLSLGIVCGALMTTALLLIGGRMALAEPGVETAPCKARVPINQLAEAQALPNPFDATADVIAEGKDIYEGKGTCSTCHGISGDGKGSDGAALDPGPRDFTNPEFHDCKTDGEMFWAIQHGINGTGMRPFGFGLLDEDEMWKAVVYGRTFDPEPGPSTAPAAPDIDLMGAQGHLFFNRVEFNDLTPGITADASVLIRNGGTADLEIGGIGQDDPLETPFILLDDPCSNLVLPPEGYCVLTVRFLPVAEGSFEDSFGIASNDPDEGAVSVTLTGTGLAPAADNAPSDFKLVAPADGKKDLDTTVTFRWTQSSDPQGGEIDYMLYYCEDSDFTGCDPVDVGIFGNKVAGLAAAGMTGIGLSVVTFVLAGWFGARRTRGAAMALAVLSVSLLASCGGAGGGGKKTGGDIEYTVNGLNPATTYFWKVVAVDNTFTETESEVWTFSTK
jgi:mono/diheme cytochrome c family protein